MWPFSQIRDLKHHVAESNKLFLGLVERLDQRIASLEDKPQAALVEAHTAKLLETRIKRLEENKEACLTGLRRINDRLEQQDERIHLLGADIISAIGYYKKRAAAKKRPAKKAK